MGNSSYSSFVLIALMVFAFYFLIIRPNKKRQQAQLATMRSLTPGTRVLTTTGIFGTIVEIGEKQAVLETSPGSFLTVLKPAIARVVKPEDEDSEWESVDDDELEDTDLPSVGEVEARAARDDNAQRPGGATTVHHDTTDVPSPWSAESSASVDSNEQDPRSGKSTTPLKD